MHSRGDRATQASRLLIFLGIGLLILSGKLWFLHEGGFSVPYWDQWDSESELTFYPLLEGRLSAWDLFSPHNEHRIVLTKLTAIGLLEANGQWDSLFECAFNAVLHVGSALFLLFLAHRWCERRWQIPFAALVVLFFTLPFSWENTLAGFQSQFYYLLFFSLFHLWATLSGPRFSWLWGCGLLAGILAVFCMASGFLAAAASLAVLAYRLLRERRWTLQQGISAGFCLLLCLAGWALKTDAPAHDYLKAEGLGMLLHNILVLSSWPSQQLFPWSLFVVVPTLLGVVLILRQKTLSKMDAVLLGFLVWVALQLTAISYSRGNQGVFLSSRYLDLVLINVILSFLFLLTKFTGRLRLALAALWLPLVLSGLWTETQRRWAGEIAGYIRCRQQEEINVSNYLRTNDPSHLRDKPFQEIPYPDAEALIQRLSHQSIRDILPASVRTPVPLASVVPEELRVPEKLSDSPAPVAFSTWGLPKTQGAILWRSAVQKASPAGMLHLKVAGDLGTPGKAFSLKIKSAQGEVSVLPDAPPGERWKNINIRKPKGDWVLEASANEPIGWFAFTEPVELGTGSYLVRKLLKHHFMVTSVAGLLIAAGILSSFFRSRKGHDVQAQQ